MDDHRSIFIEGNESKSKNKTHNFLTKRIKTETKD